MGRSSVVTLIQFLNEPDGHLRQQWMMIQMVQ
jgi:hypothetical protein